MRGKQFAAALAADPDSTQANNGLGVVELKAGNRAAAIEHFARAVRRDAGNFDALYNLATELVNDGQIGRGPAVPRAVRPHRAAGVLRPRHPAGPGAAAPAEPTAGVTSAPAPASAASMLRLTRQSVFSRQVRP